MHRTVNSAAALLLATLPITSLVASPLGYWKTFEEGEAESIVRLYQRGDELRGRVVKVLNHPPHKRPARCDDCTGARKDQAIKGMVILSGLEKKGETWRGGTILDPENGSRYDCKVWLEGGELQVRGYVGVFYRTQRWQAIDPAEVSAITDNDDGADAPAL